MVGPILLHVGHNWLVIWGIGWDQLVDVEPMDYIEYRWFDSVGQAWQWRAMDLSSVVGRNNSRGSLILFNDTFILFQKYYLMPHAECHPRLGVLNSPPRIFVQTKSPRTQLKPRYIEARARFQKDMRNYPMDSNTKEIERSYRT